MVERAMGAMGASRQASITSTESFQMRLLRSERLRALLLGGCWVIALATAFIRRELGGAVMGVDALFYTSLGVLGAAVLYQAFIYVELGRHLRLGRRVAAWRLTVSMVFDLAVPLALLGVALHYSPRGPVAALSGPALLGLPLVTLLSVLRLKPAASLWTGVAAGVGHWALTVLAIAVGDVGREQWPTLFSYGVYLAVVGIGAASVASQARATVGEAVAEAIDLEQKERELASVERDLEIARDIQRGLLPSTSPVLEGFDVAGMARPAQQTGGDYYDWQQASDGRVLVALADVTGHGIGPSIVMAVCRAYARASAPSATSAAALLRQVNALIYDDLSRTKRFITMAIAIVSPDGSLDLASAGHGPTLVFRAATGSVETYGGDGLPLGVDSEEHFGPANGLRLERGDVCLLSTDGFMEWQRASDGEQFGAGRMQEALRRGAKGSARAIIEELDRAVLEFAGGAAQHDDTTAVAIKRL
jgi:serine phosphatase RsbU (regulator of sigma subunit)